MSESKGKVKPGVRAQLNSLMLFHLLARKLFVLLFGFNVYYIFYPMFAENVVFFVCLFPDSFASALRFRFLQKPCILYVM